MSESFRLNPETQEQCNKGLETLSPLLQATYQYAMDNFNDESKKLTVVGLEGYQDLDKESYDCHSFMLSVLRRELGITTLPTLHFTTPLREDYGYETDWLYDIPRYAEQSPEYTRYMDMWRKFTKKMSEESHQVTIPYLEPEYIKDGWEESPETINERLQKVQEIVRGVIENMNSESSSRVLLMSASQGEKFRDVHSSFILGLTEDKRDLFVIEKEEIGSRIEIKKLSTVIENYVLFGAQRWPNLVLNVCKKQVQDLSVFSDLT